MKIIYKHGNIVDAVEPFILHGCNAQGVINSGVAKAIRTKWPEAYEEYRNTYINIGFLTLGKIIGVRCSDGKYVLNAITQKYYGKDRKQYASYDAIMEVIASLNFCCNNASVAMPQIGCGLGGLEWELVEKIIEEGSTNFQPVVYILE